MRREVAVLVGVLALVGCNAILGISDHAVGSGDAGVKFVPPDSGSGSGSGSGTAHSAACGALSVCCNGPGGGNGWAAADGSETDCQRVLAAADSAQCAFVLAEMGGSGKCLADGGSATDAAPTCGPGNCGAGETCATCPVGCGSCPGDGGGGGDSGVDSGPVFNPQAGDTDAACQPPDGGLFCTPGTVACGGVEGGCHLATNYCCANSDAGTFCLGGEHNLRGDSRLVQ